MPGDRDRQRGGGGHSTFGYWLPLIITATAATAGLAAYIWNERKDSRHDRSNEDEVAVESDTDEHLSYGEDGGRYPPKNKKPVRPPGPAPLGADSVSMGVASTASTQLPPYSGGDGPGGSAATRGAMPGGFGEDAEPGIVARVQDVMRRTPSPQQILDTASRRMVAGVAAAGAAVGALTAIREEDRVSDDFADHSRWSEEALQKGARGRGRSTGKRKTICIVISAEAASELDDDAEDVYTENASILSHLPPIDFDATQFFVLIYAPSQNRDEPNPTGLQPNAAPASLSSSYSAISTPAITPGDDRHSAGMHTPRSGAAGSPSSRNRSNALFHTLQIQAERIVERPTMVLPFGTPTGHVHLLRHLTPDLVYVTEPLTGQNGELVEMIRSWVGQVVVIVGLANDADGAGNLVGLVDTEDEEGLAAAAKQEEEGAGGKGRQEKWWQSSDMIGLGKGVDIVDGIRASEDFDRRIGGRE